jgi:uncharacterized membrane protein (UPF0136 family)
VTLFGVPIDDHFWPSIYPGLFVGAIIGLAARGSTNVVAGTIGGTLGAIVAFVIVAKSGSDDGLFPLAFLIASSVASAWLLVQAATRYGPSRRASS